MQLAKNLASNEPIFKEPSIPEIELSVVVDCQETVIEFKGGNNFGHVAVTKEYCASASFAINYVRIKEMMRETSLELEALSSTAEVFFRKIILRISSFVIPRIPRNREDLHPRRH